MPTRLTAALLLVGILLAGLAGTASTTEPPQEPVLKVETGMHTALINRLAVDPAGRFLVTGSDDKTVRVWDVKSGALLQTLRPPAGPGNEGKIYAVAVTPDGQTIAAGGWTRAGEAGYSIYLFDRGDGRGSGKLRGRIGGLGGVIKHLSVAPDGGRLAAALGQGAGVRVFTLPGGAEAGRDTDYKGSSYSADFDRGGRLVTTCEDGFVRLYDRSMNLTAKVAPEGHKEPYAARFSPDGAQVAVGYYDALRVDVLSARDLGPVFRLDPGDLEQSTGNLGKVAWSAARGDALLHAAGHSRVAGGLPIHRWRLSGGGPGATPGPGKDLPAAQDLVSDLVPLPGGALAFSAGDPAWGVISAEGERVLLRSKDIADFRDNTAGLLVDGTGGLVRFAYAYGGGSPASFTVPGRVLSLDPPEDGRLMPPRQSAPRLDLVGWDNTTTVRLHGAVLPLRAFERSRSLAIAADGGSFLLGTSWTLRSFDARGQRRWEVPLPGAAWAVNLSGDGRLAVAALGDGTLRWYRHADGRELLALFPHADRKRWCAFTPSGYYDVSAGGEELLGWQVSRGKDQAADFLPAAQLSGHRRPDVISRVLPAGDEALALAQANAEAGQKAPGRP